MPQISQIKIIKKSVRICEICGKTFIGLVPVSIYVFVKIAKI